MSITHPIGPHNLLRVVYDIPIPNKPARLEYTIRSLLANTTPVLDTGCMLWKGTTNPKSGYPILSIRGKWGYLHRVVAFYTQVQHPQWRLWLMSQRYIFVCHVCDNPPCINPFHLVIATGQYNAWDSQAKGRRPLKDRQLLGPETYDEFLSRPEPQFLDLDQVYLSKAIRTKIIKAPPISVASSTTNNTRDERMARFLS